MRFELGLEEPDPKRALQSAITIAVSYIVVLLVPPAREFFQLELPHAREVAIIALAVLAWTLLIRTFWTRRLVDRFLGLV